MHPLHDFVEKVFRNAVTAGCGGGNFCPSVTVSRAQMAVFLLRSKNGPSFVPPPATGKIFLDVPADSFVAAWIEELYNEGIDDGCKGGYFCPADPVLRGPMAKLLLKARKGSDYVPPPATGIFSDVPVTDELAPWIERLYREGITAGCTASPLNFCPNGLNPRGDMSVFLVTTFNLR